MATCITCGVDIPEGEPSCAECGASVEAPRGLWSSPEEGQADPATTLPSPEALAEGNDRGVLLHVSPRTRSNADITPLPSSALAIAHEPDDPPAPADASATRRKPLARPAEVVPLRPEPEPETQATPEPETQATPEPEPETQATPEPEPERVLPAFLASQILAEDLEPTDPGATSIRIVGAAVGAFGAAGVVAVGGLAVGPALAAVGLVVLAGLAIAPLSYAQRALGMLSMSLVGVAIGAIHRLGEADPFLSLLLTSGTLVLGGGLLMRHTYRAARLARIVVAAGIGAMTLWFVLSGGFETLAYFEPAWQSWAPAIPKVLLGITVLLSLLSFMDERSTAGARVWATMLLSLYTATMALTVAIQFFPLGRGVAASHPSPTAAYALAVTSLITVGAMALAQALIVAHRRRRTG